MANTPDDKDLMTTYAAGQEFALKLAEIMGLPKHLIRVEIVLSANELPTIRCEFYDHALSIKSDEILSQFAEYELHKKDGPDQQKSV